MPTAAANADWFWSERCRSSLQALAKQRPRDCACPLSASDRGFNFPLPQRKSALYRQHKSRMLFTIYNICGFWCAKSTFCAHCRIAAASSPDIMLSGIIRDSGYWGQWSRACRETNWGKRRKTQAIEWPTVFLIIACYAAWAGAAVFLWPSYPIVALIVLGVAARHAVVADARGRARPSDAQGLGQRTAGRPADRPRLSVPPLQGAASAPPCRRAADRSVRRSRKLLPRALAP